MACRFVRSDVDVEGGGHISFSVGVEERFGSCDRASVSMVFERGAQYHAEHREEGASVDSRIAVEVCLTYCLDSLTSAFGGDVPEEVFEAMLLVQATVRGMCSKWHELDNDGNS